MGVKLHVDLETLQLIQAPGQRSSGAALRFKRGDLARIQLVFLENGITPVTIGAPDMLGIQIGIKPRNQFGQSYLAFNADWLMPSEGDDAPTYECALNFNTHQINSALNIGSVSGEELPEVTLMGEITWREGIEESTSTRTFLVVVENDVNRGDEGIPVDADPPYPSPDLLLLQTNTEWLNTKSVRHDVAQNLDPSQQTQAQGNIGLTQALAGKINKSGDTVTGNLLSTASLSGSTSQVLNRGQIKTLHKPSVEGAVFEITRTGATVEIDAINSYSRYFRALGGSGSLVIRITVPWYKLAHFNSTWTQREGTVSARVKLTGAAGSNNWDAGYRDWLIVGRNTPTNQAIITAGSYGLGGASLSITISQAATSSDLVITITSAAGDLQGVVGIELL